MKPAATSVVVSELTCGVARRICALAAAAFAVAGRLWVHVDELCAVDAVGLAALLQVVQRGRMTRSPVTVSGAATFRRTLVDAHLADAVPVADATPVAPTPGIAGAPFEPRYVIAGRRVALRPPRADDVSCFARWAHDPRLEYCVGSDLLYVCRHLGDAPAVIRDAILADPTALTLIVEPRAEPGCVIGYVRLYHVRLRDGFAFLETAITDGAQRRGGCGVEATRLLLAYALDALELNRVEAKVYAYNTDSGNALRRRGFREEGRLHEAHLAGDRHVDVLVFAMFGDEMRAQRRRDPLPYMGLWPAPPMLTRAPDAT